MRTHLLSFFFAAALASLGVACGPTTAKCSTTTCTGCCDATGQCQAGNTAAACGVSAAQCTSCGVLSCTFGVCSSAQGTTGGGNGTTGGGGGTTGGGGGGNSSTLTQFCLGIIGAQYDYYVRCGTYSAAGAADQRALSEAYCSTGALWPGVKDGRVSFNSSAGQACLSGYQTQSCTAPFTGAGCETVLVGLVGANGSCFNSGDCQSALYCDTSATCPGRCVARVGLGQSTTDATTCVVGAGLYNGVCTALVPVGQSCAPTGGSTLARTCVTPARCSTAQVCVASVFQSVGQPCDVADLLCGQRLQCVTGSCIGLVTPGGACDSVRRCQMDLTCSAANVCVGHGDVGASCTSGSECKSALFCNKPTGQTTGTCSALRTADQTCTAFECATGLFCTATSPTTPGVCKASQPAGAACTYSGSYNQCLSPLYCTATNSMPTGVCANPKSVGASCSYANGSAECGSGSALYCTATSTVTTGVCANRKGGGAACTRYQECQSYDCINNVCAPSTTTSSCTDPTP